MRIYPSSGPTPQPKPKPRRSIPTSPLPTRPTQRKSHRHGQPTIPHTIFATADILHEIFAHATAPPSYYYPDIRWHSFEPTYTRNLISFRQVCTLWAECCRPIMFRCIRISPKIQSSAGVARAIGKIDKLVEILRTSVAPDTHLGTSTRLVSVELDMDWSDGNSNHDTSIPRSALMHSLATLLSLTPNLTHLSLCGGRSLEPWSSNDWATIAAARLPVIHLHLNLAKPLITIQCLELWGGHLQGLDNRHFMDLTYDSQAKAAEELSLGQLRWIRLASMPRWLLQAFDKSNTRPVSLWANDIPYDAASQFLATIRELKVISGSYFRYIPNRGDMAFSPLPALETFMVAPDFYPRNTHAGAAKAISDVLALLPLSIRTLGLPAQEVKSLVGLGGKTCAISRNVSRLLILWDDERQMTLNTKYFDAAGLEREIRQHFRRQHKFKHIQVQSLVIPPTRYPCF